MNYKIIKVKKHVDNRGCLVEFLKANEVGKENEKFGQVYFVTFNRVNVVRGNHYHKLTEEWFGVTHGTLEVVLMDVLTQERKSFILRASDKEFVRLKIGVNIVHAFKSLTPLAILFDYANRQYDTQDTDRYPYVLIEDK